MHDGLQEVVTPAASDDYLYDVFIAIIMAGQKIQGGLPPEDFKDVGMAAQRASVLMRSGSAKIYDTLRAHANEVDGARIAVRRLNLNESTAESIRAVLRVINLF